jgi:penicillin-binding protein 1A
MDPSMPPLRKLLPLVLLGGLTLVILGVLGGVGAYYFYLPRLPDVASLKTDRLAVPLRIYSADGRLLAEYGEERRVPFAYADIPETMRQAILAAEDDRFFEHPGVDWMGLARAAWNLASTGERGQGGGTITMQVARDFVGREKTFDRKFREIFLSLKIEKELEKEQILELYLNKIFLGNRAHGVGAAAEVYYRTDLRNLSLGQYAMLAGLGQRPSRVNPFDNPNRAAARRAYVLRRMLELGYITQEAHDAALLEPVVPPKPSESERDATSVVEAHYVGEMVRTEMVARYGETAAYSDGFRVVTTVNSRLQQAANASLRRSLLDYDQRWGYRGAVAQHELPDDRDPDALDDLIEGRPTVGGLKPALVTAVAGQGATVYLGHEQEALLTWEALSWARRNQGGERVGPAPKSAGDVVAVGDLVYLEPLPGGAMRLSQVPEVQGTLIALNPGDSAVLALIGGFDYFQSNFNRATQAKRQPGSVFKPFLYSAALAKGFTPATVVNDAPVVFEDGENAWRPENYTERFYGPTRLREALAQSRNLVSIRVLHAIGIQHAFDYLPRFGFDAAQLPRDLTLALGSAQATPLTVAAGFNVFANGGFRTEPYLIDRILDGNGDIVFRADPLLACEDCDAASLASPITKAPAASAAEGAPPAPPAAQGPSRHAERALDPVNAFLMTDMMREVVRRGTAAKAMELGRNDLAGKTGTANDYRDAWFAGFNSALTSVVWVGYDDMRPLGQGEVGGRTALPMWMEFNRQALAGVPERFPPQPPGIVSVRINSETGEATNAADPNAMFEYFAAGTAPERQRGAPDRQKPKPDEKRPEDDLF